MVGIALKALMFIVAVVLAVILIVFLCRLPMAFMRRKFKRSAGIDLNAAVVNKLFCHKSYDESYSVKYLSKDNDESYYYELHLPKGYSRRQRREGFPKSFIHVPGFIIETDNPYVLWTLLENISKAKDVEITMSDKSDRVFVEPSSRTEISRMLPGGMVSDKMSSVLKDKQLPEDKKEALCVVMQEDSWFNDSVLGK